MAALAQEVALLLTGVGLVADQPDDLQLGRQRLGHGVEAHVVVAGARRAVGDRVGAALQRDPGDLLGLEHPLHPDARRVDAVAQVVGLEDVGDELLEQPRASVDDDVLARAQRRRPRLDVGQLGGVEAARVDGHRRHPLAAVDEHGQAVGGVQPAEKASTKLRPGIRRAPGSGPGPLPGRGTGSRSHGSPPSSRACRARCAPEVIGVEHHRRLRRWRALALKDVGAVDHRRGTGCSSSTADSSHMGPNLRCTRSAGSVYWATPVACAPRRRRAPVPWRSSPARGSPSTTTSRPSRRVPGVGAAQ